MQRTRGFTLIELLVVLVLLGVLTSLAVLGSGLASSPARKLADEADRLNSLLRVLLDEAVLDNRSTACVSKPTVIRCCALIP